MFFKTNNGNLINVDAITAITVVKMRDFKKYPDLYSPDEMKKFGFKVGHGDRFVDCSSWVSAEAFVNEDPDHRILSHGCVGYTQLEGNEKISLISRYFIKKDDGKFQEFNDELCFLPKKNYEKPFAYKVHLSTPCGGINNDHMVFTLTIGEFKRLSKYIDICE